MFGATAAALWEQGAELVASNLKFVEEVAVPGGHIGLFMGARTLEEHWPPSAHWIAAQKH